MTWKDFFAILITTRERTWLAQVAVWGGWRIVAIILFFVFIVIVGFYIYRYFFRRGAERPQRSLYKDINFVSAFFSIIALIWLFYINHSVNSFANVMTSFHLDANIPWELSPYGISSVLSYLQGIAIMEIVLPIGALLWFAVFGIYYWSQHKPRASSGFYLQLVSISSEVDKLLIDGMSWERGDPKIVQSDSLYICSHPEGEYIYGSKDRSNLECDKDVFLLQYNKHESKLSIYSIEAETGKKVLYKTVETEEMFAIGDILQVRFRTTQEHRRRQKHMLAIPMLFFVISLLFTSSSANTFNPKACFEAVASDINRGHDVTLYITKQTSNIIADNRPAKKEIQPGKWLLIGKLKVTRPDLVDLKNLNITVKFPDENETNQLEIIDHRVKPPMIVSFVFDLDPQQIFAPLADNPLWPGVRYGVKEEEAFWNALLESVLDSFEFNGDVDTSDIGMVFATWRCNRTPPGSNIYSDNTREGRINESITRNGLLNRMNLIIRECAYRSQTVSHQDITQIAYDKDLPGEIKKSLAVDKSIQKIMVIIRWRKDAFNEDTYNVIQGDAEADTVLVLDIRRSAVQNGFQLSSQNLVQVRAPSVSLGLEEPNLDKLHKMVRRRRNIIELVAEMPFLIDGRILDDVTLTLSSGKCPSQNISLSTDKEAKHSSTRPKSLLYVGMLFAISFLFFQGVSLKALHEHKNMLDNPDKGGI